MHERKTLTFRKQEPQPGSKRARKLHTCDAASKQGQRGITGLSGQQPLGSKEAEGSKRRWSFGASGKVCRCSRVEIQQGWHLKGSLAETSLPAHVWALPFSTNKTWERKKVAAKVCWSSSGGPCAPEDKGHWHAWEGGGEGEQRSDLGTLFTRSPASNKTNACLGQSLNWEGHGRSGGRHETTERTREGLNERGGVRVRVGKRERGEKSARGYG